MKYQWPVALFLLIIAGDCSGISVNFKKLNNLRPQTTEDDQADAARAVINRILPTRANDFIVAVDQSLPENSFQVYKNKATEGKVHVIASSGVAACRGFNYYLKYFLHSQVSWDGNHIAEIPKNLPDANLNIASSNKFIYYQNVCTYSYNYAWWKWDDWERHLDWMALQGINLFLAPIQELVWSRVYRKFNLTEAEIKQHFTGPLFLPWNRMGNIRGWGGPLSMNYINFSSNLQKKIIAHARRLGMYVALPAFAGHLAHGVEKSFRNSKITKIHVWSNFAEEHCCPMYVDPTDPLFIHIGGVFLTEIIAEYGTDHIYFSDPFNELIPESDTPSYITKSSQAIYKSMEAVDEQAVWLLQGWFFVNEDYYWNNELMEAFLTANPVGTMLILDFQSERRPQYIRSKSYHGQPYIWCMLHNFGGNLGMYGSMPIVNTRPIEAKQNSTMVGFGLTPEGIKTNYFIYEFALEIGWEMKSKNLTDWFDSYILARYGDHNKDLLDAWMMMAGSVYNYTGDTALHAIYMFNTRPQVGGRPWIWYDPANVSYAWEKYLKASSKFETNDLFRHDLVDITRQYLQLLTEMYWIRIKEMYESRTRKFISLSEDFRELLVDMDLILKTNKNFLLGTWLNDLNNFAEFIGDGEIKDQYESNARYFITLFGPKGEIADYANKQWSGVVKELFLPRWIILFDHMASSFKKYDYLNVNLEDRFYRDIEIPFVESRDYSMETEGDSIQVSSDLFKKWKVKEQLSGVSYEAHEIPRYFFEIAIFLVLTWAVIEIIRTHRPQRDAVHQL